MHPRGTSSWEHNAPKSNKLLELQSHVSPWGTQTYAPNAKGKTTQGGQVLHSQIQPKQLMLERDLRGRTRRNTKQLQDLDPMGSPHRGDMVWWDSESRSPLSFPSKWRQESWREGEKASSQKVNNGGERECQRLATYWGRRLLK